MPQNRTPAPAHRGFTLVEILVVVGIIALLIALLFPAYSRVRSAARTAKCLANQRQLSSAHAAYAASNAGKFVSPRTDEDGSSLPGNGQVLHPWVLAGPNINTASGTPYETLASLEQGKLFPYVNTAKAYVSPDEPGNPDGSAAASPSARVRSYSLNGFVGVTRPNDDQTLDPMMNGLGVPVQKFKTTSLSGIPQPARTLCTIVEDDQVHHYNEQGWLVDPTQSVWNHRPACWRPDAITMSKMDGSVETYGLKNNLLADLFAANMAANWVQPADPATGYAIDWKFFRDHLLPGVIPNSTSFGGD